jgi:hypothetical protein
MVTNRATLADRLEIARRYVRSVDLGRDMTDPGALDGYVVTASAREAANRILDGIRPASTQRAFRITGPYGSGKSSFALFLTRLVADSQDAVSLADDADVTLPPERRTYRPLILVGRRTSFVTDLLATIEAANGKKGGKAVSQAIATARSATENRAALALDALDTYARHAEATNGSGVIVLLDEMGRYLEYAAAHPRTEDPSVFQQLAERAGGRGTAPLAVVGFLHHRFSDYVAGLGDWIESEWARSAERYEEISFGETTEQTLYLLGNAIVAKPGHAKDVEAAAVKTFTDAGKRGLFSSSAEDLSSLAPRLFPLHPSSIAALAVMSRRFGQNERSIFSFLQALEPHGLRRFAGETEYSASAWYRLPRLFDYLKQQGDLRLRSADRERRWRLGIDAIAQAEDMSAEDLAVLKTVSLLAVLEPVQGLKSDVPSLSWCLDLDKATISSSLDRLCSRNLLYRRPHRDDFSLWSSTSVDLDHWLEEARVRVPPVTRLDEALADLPAARPIVAHRHYHRTGTLRSFAVTTSGDSPVDGEIDGRIVVVPIHPQEDLAVARAKWNEISREAGPLTLYCLHPISQQDLKWAHELAMWKFIRGACPELRMDDLARSEVDGRITAAEAALTQALAPISKPGMSGEEGIWIQNGHEARFDRPGDLSRRLSEICDEAFSEAPILRNELINRSKLSTAIASARMRLLELMLTSADTEYLGLTGAPPERTIYLTMFHASGLHSIDGGIGRFELPSDDIMNWRPVWERISQLVSERGLVRFDELIQALDQPPYGLRSGPALLIIAAFMLANRGLIALMERNSFQPELTGSHFMRLAKSPSNFALRYLGEDDGRRLVVARLASDLAIFPQGEKPQPSIRAILEPIYAWWRALPEYTLQTNTLAPGTDAVRFAIRKGREPVDLLLDELPRACGAMTEEGEIDVDLYVERLNSAVLELSEAEPKIRRLAAAALSDAFAVSDIPALRKLITVEYEPHRMSLRDYQLRQFVDRITASGSTDDRALDGVAGLFAGRRLESWDDGSLDRFSFEARNIADQLARWLFALRTAKASSSDIRTIHVTATDGEAQTVVVRGGKARRGSAKLENQIRDLLAENDLAGEILARLLVENLATAQTTQEEA